MRLSGGGQPEADDGVPGIGLAARFDGPRGFRRSLRAHRLRRCAGRDLCPPGRGDRRQRGRPVAGRHPPAAGGAGGGAVVPGRPPRPHRRHPGGRGAGHRHAHLRRFLARLDLRSDLLPAHHGGGAGGDRDSQGRGLLHHHRAGALGRHPPPAQHPRLLPRLGLPGGAGRRRLGRLLAVSDRDLETRRDLPRPRHRRRRRRRYLQAGDRPQAAGDRPAPADRERGQRHRHRGGDDLGLRAGGQLRAGSLSGGLARGRTADAA